MSGTPWLAFAGGRGGPVFPFLFLAEKERWLDILKSFVIERFLLLRECVYFY